MGCWVQTTSYQAPFVFSQKRTGYSKSVAGLLPNTHQADIRMRSHCNAPAWWQQVFCKLSTGLIQVGPQKLLSQTCTKSAITKLHHVWFFCNLMKRAAFVVQLGGKCAASDKICNLHQVCGVYGCVQINILIVATGRNIATYQVWLAKDDQANDWLEFSPCHHPLGFDEDGTLSVCGMPWPPTKRNIYTAYSKDRSCKK